MKKWLIALLSVLLCTAMILSLTACGDETSKSADDDEDESVSDTDKQQEDNDENGEGKEEEAEAENEASSDSIVGVWKSPIPFVTLMRISGAEYSNEMWAIYEEALKSCNLTAVLEIEEEKATLSYENVDKAAEDYVTAFDAYMRNGGIYAIYETQGYDQATLDALVAESGMTMDEFIDAIVEASTASVKESIEPLKSTKATNVYTFADGEGTYGEYTLKLDGSRLKMIRDEITLSFKKQ